MRIISVLMLLLLPGCMTLPADYAGDAANADIRFQVQRAAQDLRFLVQSLAVPAVDPDFAAAQQSLLQARTSVTLEIGFGDSNSIAQKGELAALGVNLKLCADGLARMQAAGRLEALAYSREGFLLTCLGPLSYFELR